MFCGNCGREISDGAKFCDNCGAALKVADANNGGTNNGGMNSGDPGNINADPNNNTGQNNGTQSPGLSFKEFVMLPQNIKQLNSIKTDYLVTVLVYMVLEIVFSLTGVGLVLWISVIAAWLCFLIGKNKLSIGWLIASVVLSIFTGNIAAIILTAFAARRLALLRDRYKGYCDATMTTPVY